MAGLFRRAGSKVARFIARVGDPSSAASETQFYVKTEGGITMMFARRSDGTIDRCGPVVLYEGSTGAVPASGAGSRYYWAPAKRAIRAGVITATEWDDANVGDISQAFGQDTIASADRSTAFGNTNESRAAQASVWGTNGLSERIGQRTHGMTLLTAKGDRQVERLVVGRSTTTATPAVLTINGAAPAGAAIATSNRIMLVNHTLYLYEALIAARDISNLTHAMYVLRGGIKRQGAGVTSLVGGVEKTILHEEDTAWNVDAVANDTDDSLDITVTGAAATSISWVADVRLVHSEGVL